MNPPSRAPRTASRKQAGWRRRRSGGFSKKGPKRILNKENVCSNLQEAILSPEVVNIQKQKPSPLTSCTLGSPLPILTPPPFNLSFGAELSNELLLYMDELDHDLSSSTAVKPNSHGQNISAAALFDSSIISSNHPRNQSIITNQLNGSESTPRSQRVANRSASFLTTPSKNVKNHLLLSNWGLPDQVLEQYSSRGITSMFEWQAECLTLPGILSGRNLVYSAPTSAGKTLIAELLALKCVLELRKKVLIILPFVSIAHEKSNYLQQVFEPSGVKVGGFMGSQAPAGGFASVDIAICTTEKANSLINRLLEENSTHQLGVVIVDELHMIGDHHRGYLLELLLTKLMFVHQKYQKVPPPPPPLPPNHDPACMNGEPNSGPALSLSTSVQLIGMSATLPNLGTLANWLQAELYHTEFRPVPLKEMVKVGSTIYTADFKKLKDIDQSESVPGDEDDILLLCRERVVQGHSVLIFCPTKVWCESLAATLAGALAGFVDCRDERGKPFLDAPSLIGTCEQLRRTQVGLDRVLEQTVPKGIAFHHAGLTFDEREIIEGAFRKSHIKILIATSTLSSGVNLPARLVIVRTPFFQRSLIDILVYKQMVGRAGRKGVDESGESILICKPKERSKVVALLKSAPKPVTSCLGSTSKGASSSSSVSGGELTAMKRAILEVISSATATKMTEIEAYASCTLLFAELKEKAIIVKSPGKSPSLKKGLTETLLQSTIDFLLKNDFINIRHGKGPNSEAHESNEPPPPSTSESGEYFATQLGMATVASALSPDEALVVFSELRKARRSFVLENELHIIYLVTPVYIQEQWPNIDWYKYLCLWERLPPDMRLVADTLGIKESFLARAVQGRVPERTAAQKEALRIHRRFFTALALHDLVHEVPIVYVARRYGASKGLLQTLQSAAGTFAGMVTVFCNRLGWKNLELLLSQFQSRLMFGVERELCELVQISLLNGFRARVLYNSGFHTLASLATANPIAVETCLRNAVPFKSNKLVAQGHQEGMDDGGMGKASTWCAKLRRGMTEEEAARVIVQEAQEMLARQLNVPTTVWGKVDAPVLRGGAKNEEAPPNGERPIQPQSGTNQPSRKTSNKAESTVDHVTALANKIAGLRGHRVSPNTGESDREIGAKKPRLQFQGSDTSPAISCEARTADSAKPSTSKPQPSAEQSNSVAQQRVTKPNSEGPGPDFTKASSLLLSVNKESTPAQPRAKTKRQSATDESAIILSPIPPFNIDSEIAPVTTVTTAEADVNLESGNNPVSNIRAEEFKKDDLGTSLSPDKQFTIPDSLPTSMDGSMSFSFNTFEMIDAACGDIQLSGEKQQGQKQNCLILPNSAAAVKDTEQSNNIAMKCIAESPACGDINLSAVKPSNVVNDSTDFNSFSFSPLLSPSSERATAPPTKTPSRLQSTTEKGAAATAIPETPSLSTSLLLLPSSQMNSLKDLSSLCSSQMSQSGVTVIEVTSNPTLFKTFLSECLEQRVISFSVATSKVDQGNGIGSTILKPRESRGIPLPNQNEQVEGVAFCWGGMDVYYVSLCHSSSDNDSISAVEISLEHRRKAIRKIFTNCLAREKLIAYGVKKHLVNLVLSCGVLMSGRTMDPVVASWMLDPDAKEKTIHRMVLQYLPDQPLVSEDEDLNEMPLSSLATHSSNPQMRASAESILAFLLMTKMEGLLEAEGLVKPFIEVEMPSLSVLSKMELNGIGFSPEECNHQKDVLQSRIAELERSAYVLARHTFSLTSPEDIAQVLFVELKLPCGSETSSARQSKTLGPNTRRGGGGRKKIQHLSTAKDVLEKIRPLHPLPGIVLEWRRISSTLTKMVFPLFKEAVSHDAIGSVRIHPQVHIHTATGRVSLSDPNLQMVPKEFDLGSKLNLDSLSLTHNNGASNLLSDSQFLAIEGNSVAGHSSSVTSHSLLPSSVCMRNVFVPFPGGVFLAADYSQLELRILAHVSGDKKLKRFLNSDGDVFKMIAGEWLGLSADQVSEKQRQETKQVCYGMVYGIGAKALGEQLGIIEEDASQFMETFKSKYPTMKKFLTKTVQECREKGYVTTLLGRKRFLQNIHSPNIHARNQAERQAVNTTIQGSAADLVKTAMVNIDKRLLARFPESGISLGGPGNTSGTGSVPQRPTGAYLVLQLHDELLYEVAEGDVRGVARIVKHEMENALEMSVKFPVKVKVGASWGKLEPYSVD